MSSGHGDPIGGASRSVTGNAAGNTEAGDTPGIGFIAFGGGQGVAVLPTERGHAEHGEPSEQQEITTDTGSHPNTETDR